MPFQPVEILNRFDGGANTRDLLENIGRNQSPFPLNVSYRGRRFRKALGYEALGTEPDEGTPGFTLFNHRILSDEEVLIKTIGDKVKFYEEQAETFYPLTDATFTAGKRWWFDTFNGYMFGGNGEENFVRWRGSSWGQLDSGISAGATTIDLQTDEGSRFASSGSGMIEGDTFSWTGKSSDQLTGVTGVSSSHAAGARVIEKLDSTTYSSNPKGSVGVIFKNRCFVRDDSSPNFIYFSKLADNTAPHDDLANFTIAGSGSGDAGFVIAPAKVQSLDKFIDGSNNAILVATCSDGQSYLVSVTDSGSTTVGSINVPYKNLGADLAGDKVSAKTLNELILVDSFGTMRAIGYGDQSTTVKSTRLSDVIEPTLEPSNIDFSDGTLHFFKRRAYAIGKNKGANVNNFIVVKDTNPDAFSFHNHLTANDMVEWKNELIAVDSINGKAYKLLTGRTADGKEVSMSYPTPKLDHGVPGIMKQLLRIRMKGAITRASVLKVKIFFDDDNKARFVFTIRGSNESIITSPSGVAIGAVTFGSGAFGSGAPEDSVYIPFRAQLNVEPNRLYYHVRAVFEESEKGGDFEPHELVFFSEIGDPDVSFDDIQLSAD